MHSKIEISAGARLRRRAGLLVAAAVAVSALTGSLTPAEAKGDASRRAIDAITTGTSSFLRHRADPCPPPPPATPVPNMIGRIFRCRLAVAGFAAAEIDHVVAEAVTVARCESGWDTAAVVFGGRYLDRPHPATGMRYSASGVFQFIRATAETYIDGGYARVHDAAANIDAAARLYLDNRALGRRGWEDWECAAVNGIVAHASVLPGWPNGPAALPEWAHGY